MMVFRANSIKLGLSKPLSSKTSNIVSNLISFLRKADFGVPAFKKLEFTLNFHPIIPTLKFIYL